MENRYTAQDSLAKPENHGDDTVSLRAFSAYDLPSVSVEALVQFFDAAGYPVNTTWFEVIKAGFFNSWPELIYNNASKRCHAAAPTTKGHVTQVRQGERSTTKQKTPVYL